jgi:hypothetical protein
MPATAAVHPSGSRWPRHPAPATRVEQEIAPYAEAMRQTMLEYASA